MTKTLTNLLKTNILKMTAAVAVLGLSLNTAQATDPDPANWDSVVEQAKGQTVYFNAWGGATNINDYIVWAAGIVKDRYDITVEHVKLDDTANAVATVIAEKTAGRDKGGSIDLIWINGENFA
ncbi:MAG: ABC transporter substrate-binding protein, partial [Rhizobiaceae bacterium]